METIELTLPRHWACALINGDESGLEDDDANALNRFTDWMVDEYGACWCVSVDDEECGDFRRYHDATDFGVLACDVATFTFDIGKHDND